MKANSFLFFLFLMLQSCIVVNHSKYQKQENGNRCALHDIKMHKRFVKTTFGTYLGPDNSAEYPNAKTSVGVGCIIPIWPIRRLAIIYVCPTCNKLKKETN